ncbi:MAG: thioredoxin family protein [Bacteroidetes bacterium]|nr:thioredoxin family protein [Bacteroidota bacterium]
MKIKNWIFMMGLCLGMASCASQKFNPGNVPTAYKVKTEGNEKILVGIIDRNILEKNDAFPWFKKSYDLENPDVKAVEAFKKNIADFQMIVFAGTWCEDTHNLLGGFYKLIDQSGFPGENITLIGVDHEHRSLFDLAHAFNITNVPTFIVMKNGKEMGRVVEYGKSGNPGKDLGEIVNALK